MGRKCLGKSRRAVFVLSRALFLTPTICAAFASGPLFADPAPSRVVSLDYCTDQYVLALADRSQILALSPEAGDIHSFHREKAAGLATVRPTAEAVLALKPDLVLRSWGGDARLLALLERRGIRTVTADYGIGPEAVAANSRRFAEALGQPAKTLALPPPDRAAVEKDLRAVYLAPGGITAGGGTFVDEIIRAAGLRSYAGEKGLAGWRPLPLEAMAKDPPELIVASFFDHAGARASNWSIARHAVVRRLLRETPVLYVPSRYFSCNGLFLSETVALIEKDLDALNHQESAARGTGDGT